MPPGVYTLGMEDGLLIFYRHKTRKKLVTSKMSDGLLKVFLCVWVLRSISSKVWESCILVAAHLQLLVVIIYMSYWGCFWRSDSTLSSVSRSFYVWFVSIGCWSHMLFPSFSNSGTDHPHVTHCLGARCWNFLCLNELGGFCSCNYHPCIQRKYFLTCSSLNGFDIEAVNIHRSQLAKEACRKTRGAFYTKHPIAGNI